MRTGIRKVDIGNIVFRWTNGYWLGKKLMVVTISFNGKGSKKTSRWLHLKNNCVNLEGNWYYLNDDGKMQTGGWFYQDNAWYYIQSDE